MAWSSQAAPFTPGGQVRSKGGLRDSTADPWPLGAKVPCSDDFKVPLLSWTWQFHHGLPAATRAPPPHPSLAGKLCQERKEVGGRASGIQGALLG